MFIGGTGPVYVALLSLFHGQGKERVSIFGDFGLANQLGSAEYARPRRFRERLDQWLDLVRVLWPTCPARISSDGNYILIAPAVVVAKEQKIDGRT